MLVPISESELFIMQYLWTEMEQGKSQKSFADILEYAKKWEEKGWKKQTVNTFLSRLKLKGLIDVIPTNKYSLYQPIVSREEYLQLFLDSILPNGRHNKRYRRLLIGMLKKNPTTREKNSLLRQAERL